MGAMVIREGRGMSADFLKQIYDSFVSEISDSNTYSVLLKNEQTNCYSYTKMLFHHVGMSHKNKEVCNPHLRISIP